MLAQNVTVCQRCSRLRPGPGLLLEGLQDHSGRPGEESEVLDFFFISRERKCLQVQSYQDIPSGAESRHLRRERGTRAIGANRQKV
jgi:hypothetical protein